MIALFVTTAAVELGPAPIALLRLAERGVERRARRRDLRGGGLALDELHEPGDVAVAVPEEALDLVEQLGREAAQPLLRAELEDAVRLEPRLLGPAPVPAAAARLRARSSVGGDDVEVGARAGLLPARPGRARR